MSSTFFERSSIVPLGFAMAVTMWAAAYVLRLPSVMAPSWLLLAALLAAAVLWGGLSGRWTGGGWRAGAAAGAVAAVVNMLILGSLLTGPDGGGVRPGAGWWVPGSVLVVAVLAGLSAAAAAEGRRETTPADWTGLFAKVAVAATFLLVVAGGLVTSHEAGLAVVDWPNTFGSNMFLYPLARMTGGIYYEHAHRLFGALVGLTTLVLAFRLARLESRRWLRRLGLAAVVLVVVQGVLGGLRVTGRFTLSTSELDVAPNIGLAVVHGVLGQLFLAVLVIVAAATSRRWRSAPPAELRPASSGDRSLQLTLIVLLVVQLVLGAAQRHLAWGLIVHISLAVLVTVVAIIAGARAWGLYEGSRPVDFLGKLLMVVVSLQVALGIAALAVTQGRAVVGNPTTLEATIATAHQATGAALLALSVLLAAWTRRLFAADTATAEESSAR